MMSEAISQFLANDWQKILLIKGGWGSGKTFFMKNTMENDAFSSGYTYAYTSIAGINSIDSLKRRLLGNIIVSDTGSLAKIENKVRPFLWFLIDNVEDIQKFLPDKFKPIDLSKIAKALINPSLKHTNFVIIIDDIEKCKMPNFDEIYSFLSFIKESTGCKVILIGNDSAKEEDNVKTSEAKNQDQTRFINELKTSEEWKHKIIDQELSFKLTNDEISGLFTKNQPLKEAIAEHLDHHSEKNLRDIRKATVAAEYFGSFAPNDIAQKIMKTVFDTAISCLPSTNIDFSMLGPSKIEAIELAVRAFLNNGYLTEQEKSDLTHGIRALHSRTKHFEQSDRLSEIADLHNFSFASREEISKKIEDALDSCGDVYFLGICHFQVFLESNGYYKEEIAAKIKNLLTEKSKSISSAEYLKMINYFQDDMITNLVKDYCSPRVKPTITEIVENGHNGNTWLLESIEFLNVGNSTKELQKSISKENFHKLSEIYQYLIDLPRFERSKQTFDQILEDLAKLSPENRRRVERIKNRNP